ncbi:MAG: TolB family protein, partial [Acidimicrobiia bacterium]
QLHMCRYVRVSGLVTRRADWFVCVMKELNPECEAAMDQQTVSRGSQRRLASSLVALVVMATACGDGAADPETEAIIAFASDRDHEGPLDDFATVNVEIYTMAADGTGIVRITHDPRVDFYPRWSPAGTEIAFISNRHSGTESMDLYVIDLTTEEVRRVTTTGGVFGHEWSPDGSALVYAHETSTGSEVRIVLTDGTDDRFVVEGSWPSFSPDGSQILFTQGEFFGDEPQRLAVVDADGGSVSPVALDLDNSSESTWSPAGDRIAFMSNPNGYTGPVESWDEEIYVSAVDGTNVVRVSNRPGNDHWPPSWSADGLCLAWQGDDPDPGSMNADIIVAAVDTGESINLTADSGFFELFPDWSPGTCPL